MRTQLLLFFLLSFVSNYISGNSIVRDTIKKRLERAAQMKVNNEAALELMKETLNLAIQEKDKRSEWDANDAIAFFYKKTQRLDESLAIYQKNILLAQELKDRKLEGLALQKAGNGLMNIRRPEKAKEYFLKALAIFKEIKDETNEAGALANLGNINTQLGLSEEALQNYLDAYNLFGATGDYKMQSRVNSNISYYYLINGKGKEALPYAKHSLRHSKKEKDTRDMSIAYGSLGYAYSLIGDFQNAFIHFQHCIDTSQKYQYTRIEYDVYKDMAETYKKMGDATKAIEYLEKHYTLRDSIIDEETQRRVNELEVEYESAQQEQQIKDLEQQQEISSLQLSLLAIGTLLLGLIGWMVIKRQRSDLREKQELISSREQIHQLEKQLFEKELQQKALEQEKTAAQALIIQQKEEETRRYAKVLENSNKELEQFAHVVSHDLREPIRMIKSYMGLIKRKLDQPTLEKTEEYFHFAMDGAERLDQLIKGVLSLAKVQQQELQMSPINLDEITSAAVQNLRKFISERNGNVHYQDLPTIQGDMSQIIQLFQNLISNGLKYNTNDSPTVWINHKVLDNHIEVSFKDNGIGISEENKERVFQMFQRLERHRFSGTGIGLSTCQKIVQRHHGTIRLDSKKGEGTTFTVRLPLE